MDGVEKKVRKHRFWVSSDLQLAAATKPTQKNVNDFIWQSSFTHYPHQNNSSEDAELWKATVVTH